MEVLPFWREPSRAVEEGSTHMRFRNLAAIAAIVYATAGSSHASASPGDRGQHLLTDRESDCAVYDVLPTPATDVTWSGDCSRGLAWGRGTAVFFRDDRMVETIAASFRDGHVLAGDADIRWGDGAHYAGEIDGGVPGGLGVLTRANGDRFEGHWKNGVLNGDATAVWANGDRYDGQWRDGKAEGRGVQIWANGDRYDGQWHNDMPNGTGSVRRKDGTQFTAVFVDGKRQAPAPVAAAPPPADAAKPVPAAAAAPAPAFFLAAFAGKPLTALDGSTVELKAADGGILRTITAPDGRTDAALFRLVNDGLGSIADPDDHSHITGFFRASDTALDAEYADGHSEQFSLADSGGLSLTLKTAAGQTACMAWYPQGHVFSAEERRAAVAAYAQRLGVSVSAGPPVHPHCQGHVAAAVVHVTPAVARVTPSANPRRVTAAAPPPYRIGDGPANLQDVPVHDSKVHPIDKPTNLAGDTGLPDEPVASNCLKVDADGGYWGFRNHCGYSVQFAYCLLHGTDQITACGAGSNVSGSAPAGGFSPLFADKGLAENNAEHEFRWVACRGGAGEVVPHLDVPDPASGRCLRTPQQASN